MPGQDFFISKRARIDYKKREIIMGDVTLDKILPDEQVKEMSIVLKARCETHKFGRTKNRFD